MSKDEKALEKAQPTALAANQSDVPEFMRGDTRGTDHITKDDMQMPRLALAQQMSPQIQEGDPSFIEGLKMGDMFNSLTGENYGKGPLQFIIVRSDKPRGVEFLPLEEGGGVKDFDVPVNDERMQFTTDADGNRVKPVATMFYDYIVILIPKNEMIALSFKSTGLKVARQLNGLIKFRGTALFSGLYELSTGIEKGKLGTYAVYRVKNAGWVQDEELYNAAAETFEGLKDKNVVIDREGPEGETTETVNVPNGDKVPF
jgi:hypothetical protein